MRIRSGKLIPRDDGKRIEEFVGNAHTNTSSLSVAHMWAPPGWAEPPQTPEFDEAVIVLSGSLTLDIGGRVETVEAGEVGFVPRGERVTYSNAGRSACDYWSICVPGFLPKLAHMDASLAAAPPKESNSVVLEIAHPRGARLEGLLRTLSLRFMRELKLKKTELSISLVTDRSIRRLNRSWRKKDKPTDVLSFPGGEAPRGAPRLLGDVVISLDTAERVAKSLRKPVEAELSRYLAHGILHLLGHDHLKPAEAKRMRALENKLLGEEGMIGEGVYGD